MRYLAAMKNRDSVECHYSNQEDHEGHVVVDAHASRPVSVHVALWPCAVTLVCLVVLAFHRRYMIYMNPLKVHPGRPYIVQPDQQEKQALPSTPDSVPRSPKKSSRNSSVVSISEFVHNGGSTHMAPPSYADVEAIAKEGGLVPSYTEFVAPGNGAPPPCYTYVTVKEIGIATVGDI